MARMNNKTIQENLNDRLVSDSEYELIPSFEVISPYEKSWNVCQSAYADYSTNDITRNESEESLCLGTEPNIRLFQHWKRKPEKNELVIQNPLNAMHFPTAPGKACAAPSHNVYLTQNESPKHTYQATQIDSFQPVDQHRMLVNPPTSCSPHLPDKPSINNNIADATASLSIFKRLPLNKYCKRLGLGKNNREEGFFVEFRRVTTENKPTGKVERTATEVHTLDNTEEVSPEHVRPLIVILWCGVYCIASVLQQFYHNYF